MEDFMSSSPIILLLLLVAGGIGVYYRNKGVIPSARIADRKFVGAFVLSAFASLVFGLFFVIGILLIFSEAPDSAGVLQGVQEGAVRVAGGFLALFGMCGLLIARGVVILIEIEKAVRSASATTVPNESAQGGTT